MRKIIFCMHTSLDGFVAGPDGEMDWINVDEELFDYSAKLTGDADTALYGRVTYQMMEAYWPTAGGQPGASKHDISHSEWYNRVKKIVLSKTLQSESDKTKIINSNLSEEINNLKKENGKNILIFGSPTVVHSLMQENLIDEFWLFVNPIVLGNGIPLFKDIKDRIKLQLQASNVFISGVIGLHYSVYRE